MRIWELLRLPAFHSFFASFSILYFSLPPRCVHTWFQFIPHEKNGKMSFPRFSSCCVFASSVIYKQTLAYTTLAHIEGQWEVKWEQCNERKLEWKAGRVDKYRICSRAAVHQYENEKWQSRPPQCPSDHLRGICLSGSHMLAGQKVRPFADLSLVEPWKHFVVQ